MSKAEAPKGSHGGNREGSGRPSKEELEAIARGEPQKVVMAIRRRRAEAAKKKQERKQEAERAKVLAEPKKHERAPRDLRFAMEFAERSRQMRRTRERRADLNPFQLPQFPPEARPPKSLQMAMDNSLTWAGQAWAASTIEGTADAGLMFMGYPFLSLLAQRQEYRLVSETIADDATRRWIDFEVTGEKRRGEKKKEEDERQSRVGAAGMDEGSRKAGPGAGRSFDDPDPDEREARLEESGKADKVKAIKDEMLRLEARDRIYCVSRDDGFFGRSHLYLNFGTDIDGDAPDELRVPIGDGRDETSRGKVSPDRPLKSLRVIEPVWTYPTTYNAVNPLREDWYNPQVWYVLGKEIHRSRLPTFISRPVPDLLKPAYSFGGISLSQLVKPYVDIWLTTRSSVAELVHSFSVMVLMTDLQTILQGGGGAGAGIAGDLLARVEMFNAMRDNQNTFVLNKDSEDFKNVSASLAGLGELQQQALEHICVDGSTLIETDRGPIPIKEVTADDMVLTREGFNHIKWVGVTGYSDSLIEIEADGAVLRVTEEHPIWSETSSDFVAARNVSPSHRLLVRRNRAGAVNHLHPSESTPTSATCDVGDWITTRASVGRVSAIRVPRQPVYNLEVEDGPPEFFANGILVHNCVAARLPLVKFTGISPSGLNACLTGDTLIETDQGYVPILDVRAGQKVMTREGWAPIEKAACTGYATELIEIKTAESTIRCTADHRIWLPSTNAFVSAANVRRGDRLLCRGATEDRSTASDEMRSIVSSVRRVAAREFVYDIQVARGYLPEFFANGVCVHNSSEGEIRSYYDTIAAYQNRFIRPNLTKLINFVQLSLFGDIDPEITFEFEPLWEMSENERSELQKQEADTRQVYVDMGAIGNDEVRQVIIDDPKLPFADLDPEDVPDLREEEESGLVPPGAGKGLEAVLESGQPGELPGAAPSGAGGGEGGDPAFADGGEQDLPLRPPKELTEDAAPSVADFDSMSEEELMRVLAANDDELARVLAEARG